MKKLIASIVFLVPNIIVLGFMLGLLSNGVINKAEIGRVLLSLNIGIIIFYSFVLYMIFSKEELNKEIIEIKRKKSESKQEIKEIKKVKEDDYVNDDGEDKKIEIFSIIILSLFAIGMIAEYWSEISRFLMGILLLITSLLGGLFSMIFSISGLLVIIILILLFKK